MSAETIADPVAEPTVTEDAQVVTLTAKAADKVASFLEDSEDKDVALRVAVQAGGCAGFRYALFFDDRQLDGDVVTDQHGVQIRIDKMSSPYIQGAVIDWKETLEASGFAIENPNATNTCACGDSAGF